MAERQHGVAVDDRPRRRTWSRRTGVLVAVLVVAAVACDVRQGIVSTLVPVPEYPSYDDADEVAAQAQRFSGRLDAYIDDWLDGRAPAQLPDDLVPDGIDDGITNLRLVEPDAVGPDDVWLVREAGTLDPDALRGYFPDPNATYAIVPAFLLPFEHRMVVEGEFPHARFFDLQASPPFDPRVYRYDGAFGAAEVPIVDVDIDPVAGHTNPFRVGANRRAKRRSYRVEWTMAAGDGTRMEPAYRPPYRAEGNHRYAAALQYQGPWGLAGTRNGHGRGVWNVGHFWLRYYAPDRDAGPLGGVGLPDVHYETPEGRRYMVVADVSGLEDRLQAAEPVGSSDPMAPDPTIAADVGWFKGWGIFHSIASGTAMRVYGIDDEQGRDYVRRLQLGVTGRGERQPPPGNYAVSASDNAYVHYLTRGMALEEGRVAVLTGRLPTTPRTRGGQRRMRRAQARYWSLTGYDPRLDTPIPGTAVHSVMDDQIVTDADGWYTIALSRPEDRPRNSRRADGVTWVDFGPIAETSWTVRWLTVAPQWEGAGVPTPTETRLSWAESAWTGSRYDPALLGRNDRSGFLGDYHPVVHYLTTEQFEALASPVDPRTVPRWTPDDD